MDKKKISVKDIAEMTGVSVATVSRVINQNGRFSKATEQRVNEIIKEYNFQPNQLARGLRVSKTKVIGILVPDITNEFFANIILELQKQLLLRNYLALICNTNEMVELEEKQLEMLLAQQVSGLIYISGDIKAMEIPDLPVVFIDRQPPIDFNDKTKPYILIESDNEKGGYLAAKELLSNGCKKMACISFNQKISAHIRRVKGYESAMEENNLPSIVRIVDSMDYKSSEQAVKELLDQFPDVDGIFFTSDTLAIGGMRYLQQINISIPDRIKIIGFDDISICQSVWPPLTTMRQDVDEFGRVAVNAMIGLIDGVMMDKMHHQIPVKLIQRKSTGQRIEV